MRVRRQSGRRVAVGITGLVCAGACAASASAAQTSVTINQASGIQGWAVPAGVSSIQMDVWGAGGGAGWGAAGPRGAGGAGAEVTATLAVSAGEWLGFGVGQAGANGSPQVKGCAFDIPSDVSQGGFGGVGGLGTAGSGAYGDYCFGGGSGGGGGDTWVRDSGYDTLMDVGGGGGGGGGGGIAGYAGGAGGSGGATAGNGGNGTGSGFGLGGTGAALSGPATLSGTSPWAGGSGGAGGGNGMGPNAGAGGTAPVAPVAAVVAAPAERWSATCSPTVTIGTAPAYQQGQAVITYTTPPVRRRCHRIGTRSRSSAAPARATNATAPPDTPQSRSRSRSRKPIACR